MLFDGNFYNNRGDEIKVVICTKGDKAKRVEIGNEKDGIFFTDDPVEITSQANDTFDHLLCYQASVRLLCRNFVPEFFCSSCRDAVVNILRNGECIFVGYVEPQAFSQGYNEDYDEVELTCIDCLSALSYSNYRNVGAAGVLYDALKGKAAQRTFYDIIAEILNDVGEAANYMGGGTFKIMYDGSKALSNGTGDEIYNIFQNISINELLFFGDEEDDMWTQEDVLNEILKYLNLHIVQEGTTFYIFSWESIRKNSCLNLYRIDEGSEESIEIPTYRVGKDIEVADCDTKISIGETYNELLLTDNVTEVNDVIESPLDDDSLIAAGNFQKYMTEYIAEGEGKTAYNSMYAMTTGRKTTDWQDASQVDWFCWPKAATNWKFYGIENGSRIDMYEKYPADGTKQQDILNKGLTAGIGACVCAFGKIERKNGGNTSSLVTSVSMENYLIISTMGRSGYPSEKDILASCPVAEYTGNKSGGTFSPVDSDTINYIVISGKMVLNPVMAVTDIYYNMMSDASWNSYWHKTVPSRNNKDGRYYTRKYWESEQWNQEPVYSEANKKESSLSFYPYTGTGPQEHEYAYSAVGVATDTIKRVGLISCMLIIGDKCVVECNKGDKNAVGGTSQGEGDTDDFVWKKYKERSECASDDEYYAQSFTIGIDPKLRDKIIGTEFEIRKNAPYTKGITAEGTAIPIRMSDHVSGSVQFKILGPVNAEWNEVTRRHPSFWRHTKWYQDSNLLLQEINSIMLKEFKIEVVSDNGKIGAVSDEKDIVYKSDTGESFVNRKDDLEFRFTTALTSKECKALGVNNAVKLSSPQNEATKNALADIYDRNQNLTDKPEKLYVDAYWQEWHEPRVVMTQNVIEPKKGLSFASIFSVPVIGKRFYVQGIDRNLTEGTAVVTMRELF
mgnify:FL=1